MSLIQPNSIVRVWSAGDSYSVDNTMNGLDVAYITKAPGNSSYDEVMAWIAAGNTPEPEFTPAELLETKRREKIVAIKRESVVRIAAVIPELDDTNKISVVAALWPVLDNPGGNADFALARDIYLYSKTKLNQAQTATEAQLDAYDPTTDTGWPT